MNMPKKVNMSWGNLAATLVLTGAMLTAWDTMDDGIITNAHATEINAAEIEKQKELQALRDKRIEEKLTDIQQMLQQMAKEEHP